MSATCSESGKGLDKIKEDMKKLMNLDVLVGVPEDESARTDPDGEVVNNAQLCYLHTNGSDLQHIPKRPIIEPAIAAHKEEISAQIKKVGEFALAGNTNKANAQLKKVGILGQNIIRSWFLDPRNGWPPNSQSTIKEKLLKTPGKLGRDIRAYVDAGGSLNDITGLEGMIHPLIDSGQLRKAMTYVIRDKNK